MVLTDEKQYPNSIRFPDMSDFFQHLFDKLKRASCRYKSHNVGHFSAVGAMISNVCASPKVIRMQLTIIMIFMYKVVEGPCYGVRGTHVDLVHAFI